jgi:UDPglucose 6-dehydrogenase
MKITIFGTGYVGLVTGACLADVGHEVMCMDVDENKIARLRDGEIPIYEPGLESRWSRRNEAAGRLRSPPTRARGGVRRAAVHRRGHARRTRMASADLQYVLAVAKTIGEHMDEYKVVVDKSTVPVGTADRVRETMARALPRAAWRSTSMSARTRNS